MKSSKLILALWLGASAWAQTLPQKPTVAAKPPVAAKPSGGNAASPKLAGVQSGQALKPTAAVKPMRKPPASSVAQTYGHKPGRRVRVAQRHVKTNAEAPKKIKARRDPFVSPVVERVREVATCAGTGRQCLLVGEVALRGVVHSPSGFIAVVVNGDHTYFLRENDPLADGSVERITNDAIVLRERSSDALGRQVTREITKKLGAVPAV